MPCFTLLRLRREAGLTQAELAEKAGLTMQTVSRLEVGTIGDPGTTTLKKIAAALGRETAEVFPELLSHAEKTA